MKICKTITEINSLLAPESSAAKRISFVPTMGGLHEGHLSLMKLARYQPDGSQTDCIVASIFVNPTQFNDKNDFEKYPRVLEQDAQMLESVGVGILFAPSPDQIYQPNFQSWVNNDSLSLRYEGASRPGHFRGVTTVVSILFNIVRPTVAVFGEKDFQQLRIIEKMVDDLKFPITIVRAPISREEGGLARSSRNARLSPEGRKRARALSRGLFIARDAFQGGERRSTFLTGLIQETLATEAGISIDYIEIVDESTLEPINPQVNVPARLLIAATVEGVRLIDNISLV